MQSQDVRRRASRRQFLRVAGRLAALGGVSLLAACQGQPETVVVTPRTATEAAASPTPAGASPAPSPAAVAASPVASPTPQSAAKPAAKPDPPAASPGPGRLMYQADPQHTGRSPHAGPRGLAVLRTFDTTRPGFDTPEPGDPRPNIESSAAVAPDGTIYIGNFPGNLFALRDPGRGDALDLVWRFHPPGASSFHGTPAIGADGTVYLGFSTGGATPEARGSFYALRAPAGGIDQQAAWSVDLGPGRQTSSPTLGPDGTIYAVSGSGRLFAIAPNGNVNWIAQTGPSLKAAPALGADGTVYLSSMDGKLYAVAPPPGGSNQGSVRWAFDFGAHLGPTPLVTTSVPPPGANAIGSGASPTVGPDGTIYVGANNSNFYAIAPEGSLKWLYEAEREVAGIWSTAALSPDGGTLYFGANKGGIYALDSRTGAPRWKFDMPGSVYSSPTLDAQGVLYTGSTIKLVLALDAADGREVSQYQAGDPVWTAPAIRPDGSLVVAETTGRVMLLGAQ